MPGVTNGENWNGRDPHLREFDAYSRTAMSPQRRLDSKSSSVSQYSNGYSTDHNSDLNEEKPTYLLEHLATFSVGAEYGLSTPKDGLRRLLQMEKSSGIWTQKMQMRLEKKWVVIIDNENGDIVERFPMNLISEPTAYTNNDTRELYNNILIFIVKDDPKNKNHNPSEMHIFQCARVSAQEVVNEMKMFMSGKWKPGHRDSGRHIPPPPSNPPPDPPLNGVNVREQVNLFNAVAAAAASPPRSDGMAQRIAASGYSQKMDRLENRLDRNTGYSRDSNDETSSTSSDKYERDVAILNHCFDDIERFIARLQHAAAAFKELERRQKSRKNKKKDMGDGMLSMRAKPPSEREFFDILQKFKLSFNLLAKLKSHIHDPNAPELVHFLFTPLALIVDAAKDSNYSTTLPSRVVAPLLTRDAKELLMNCCTSKESDLWHSLGDSWVISRDQWKGYEGSFHPVFSNGWAPENPFPEERERPDVTTQPAASSHKYRREEMSRAQDETDRHPNYRVSSRQDRDSRFGSDFYYNDRGERDRPNSPGLPSEIAHPPYDSRYYDSQNEVPRREREREPYDRSEALTPVSDREFQDHRDRDMRSDFSADSIEHGNPMDPHRQFERQQRQWLEELKAKGAKTVQVMYPRTANNDKELTVVRGEFLEVLDDSRKWWKAKNIRGQVAHVPHTIVGPPNVEDDIFSNPLYGSRGAAPKDTYYTPSDSPNGRDRTDETGPREPAPQRTPALPTPAPADWVRRERQGKKAKSSNNINTLVDVKDVKTEEDIPEEKNIPKPKSALPKSASLQDLLHEELKLRVSLGPKFSKRFVLGQNQSILQCSYITPQSSACDVQMWLGAKGFSAKAQQIFQNVKGEEIFQLKQDQLEEDLGTEEGLRLFDQIKLQKNFCGKSKEESKPEETHKKELACILEERRKRIAPDEEPASRKNSFGINDSRSSFQSGKIQTESDKVSCNKEESLHATKIRSHSQEFKTLTDPNTRIDEEKKFDDVFKVPPSTESRKETVNSDEGEAIRKALLNVVKNHSCIKERRSLDSEKGPLSRKNSSDVTEGCFTEKTTTKKIDLNKESTRKANSLSRVETHSAGSTNKTSNPQKTLLRRTESFNVIPTRLSAEWF